MRSLVGLLSLLLLGGCAATVPAISDIRSDVVKVQARANFWYQFPGAMEMNQEAQRGCGEYGNVVSHALSERCVDVEGVSGLCVRKEYLYACKPPEAKFHNPHE